MRSRNLFSLLREQRWRIAGFCAIAAALNYADRAAVSSVLPALRREFALGDVQLGLIGSVFLWSYAIASPFAGLVADRWSRAKLVTISLVLWSVVTALTGVADGLVMLVSLRCLLGLFESLYLPAATALIASHHGPESRAKAMSLHTMGLNFGVVLGGTFAGHLADQFGWRSGFWVLGITGVLLAVVSPFFLSDAGRSAQKEKGTRDKRGEAWAYLIRVPSFHVLLAKAMLAGVGTWIFLNWLSLYFREEFNMTLGSAGFAGTFMTQISTVLGIALGGWLSDRVAARNVKKRMLLQALSYFVAAPFLLLFLGHPSFPTVAVAVSAFSLFRGLGQANENPTLCEVIPAQFRSTAVGLMNTSGTAAGGVGVVAAGLLKHTFGLEAIFAGISLLFVIAGALLLLAYRLWVERDIARANITTD